MEKSKPCTTDTALQKLMTEYQIPSFDRQRSFETPQERSSVCTSGCVQTSFHGGEERARAPNAESSLLCTGGQPAIPAPTKKRSVLNQEEIDKLLNSLASSGHDGADGRGEGVQETNRCEETEMRDKCDKTSRTKEQRKAGSERESLREAQRTLIKQRLKGRALAQGADGLGSGGKAKGSAGEIESTVPWCEAYGLQKEIKKLQGLLEIRDQEIKALKADNTRLKNIAAARNAADQRKAVFLGELTAAREENDVLRARIAKMEMVFQALKSQQ